MRRTACLAIALVSLVGAVRAAGGGHDWPRYGGDDQVTNDASAFATPTLSSSSVSQLSPLWTVSLDGPIVASPLYVHGIQVGGQNANLVFVATEGGTLYALRRRTGSIVWQRQIGTTAVCEEEAPGGRYGISSTPVVDRDSQTIFVIGASGILHAFDLATGEERAGWPLRLLEHPDGEHVWGGLTLSGGRVYVPVASYCDEPDPTGHVAEGRLIAVDVTEHRVVVNFDVVPGPENLGGIWGYGGASVDPTDGSIWVTTGNSWVFDPACGCVDEGVGYAESIVKLSPDLTVLDSDRPAGLPSTILEDTDFGSTPLLFQPAGCPPLAAAHNKNGMLYVWERSSLASGPIWSARIGPDDLENPFIGEPSWSDQLQTLFVANARIYGPEGVVRYDAVAAFQVAAGCRFPEAPTWVADAGQGTKPPPLVVGDLVFVPGGLATALYALDVHDGTVLATLDLDNPDFSSPILADREIIAGDFAGTLHAFALGDGCPGTTHRAFGGRLSCLW